MKNLLVGAMMMMTTIGMILGSSNDVLACGKCGNEKNHQVMERIKLLFLIVMLVVAVYLVVKYWKTSRRN